jgi:hypothetical protein
MQWLALPLADPFSCLLPTRRGLTLADLTAEAEKALTAERMDEE